MQAFGDGYVVTHGLIKGEEYSFLVDSKTALFAVAPSDSSQRGVPIFFLGVSLTAALGVWLDGRSYALTLPLLFIAGLAASSLARSFRSEAKDDAWKLYLGSGESPVLIYSSRDVATFEAKRNEIEQALLTRPQR